MRRRSISILVTMAIVALALVVPAVQAFAQEQPCLPGELCGNSEAPTFGQGGGPVVDPAGSYIRSFIVMGLIAAVVATYLAVALGGKRLPFRRRTA